MGCCEEFCDNSNIIPISIETSSCPEEGLGWILGRISSPKELPIPGTAGQGSAGVPILRKHMDVALEDMVAGNHDGAGLMAGLTIKGRYQP